jgi:SSS family solute:Na+ symporter
MIGVKSALDAWWKLAGIFSGAVLGLFLLGLLVRRAGSGVAAIAVACGVAVILTLTFAPLLHGNLTIVLGTTTIVLVGFLGACLLPGKAGR